MPFDVTVLLDSIVFTDEDVALFDGLEFMLFFDASLAGVDTALDLDALHYDAPSGTQLLAFDGGGFISTVSFFDDDLLAYDGSWALAYDGSDNHLAWSPADLDAAFGVFITDLIFRNGFE